MLLNSYIAWNLATKSRRSSNKRPLRKHEFYIGYAEELLSYNDSDVENAYTKELCLPVVDSELHTPEKPSAVNKDHVPNYEWRRNNSHHPHCAVCKLEGNLQSRAKSGKCSSRVQRTLAYCDSCGLFGHTSVIKNSKFQNITQLAGKSCFDIIHDDYCKGLWDATSPRRRVSTKHHVYDEMLGHYDLSKKKGSRFGGRKV